MQLDFNVTSIYYCDIVVIAMSVKIREKQDIEVNDHKTFDSVFRKINFILLGTTCRNLIVSGSIKKRFGMLHQL